MTAKLEGYSPASWQERIARMNADWGDGATIFTAIAGFVGSVLYAGRRIGNLESKVDAIQADIKDHPAVTVASCELMKGGCQAMNNLRFEHDKEAFAELRQLVAESNKASECRYKKLMDAINEMKERRKVPR